MDFALVSRSAELAFGTAESEMFMIQSQSVFVDAPVWGGFNIILVTFFRKRKSYFHTVEFFPNEDPPSTGIAETAEFRGKTLEPARLNVPLAHY